MGDATRTNEDTTIHGNGWCSDCDGRKGGTHGSRHHGFHIEHWNDGLGTNVRLNLEIMLSLQVMGTPQGGVYRLKDESILSNEMHRLFCLSIQAYNPVTPEAFAMQNPRSHARRL